MSNLAAGKPVNASSFEHGLYNSPPANAVDTDLSTR
jgi:hypothetical protein